jgi:tetratricopeptide (TPR) repeat protein
MTKRLPSMILILVVAGWMLSCGSPREKMIRFYEKGRDYYQLGDPVRARLEFKNAVQIDPTFARGYYYLGLVELQAKRHQKAFGYFSKAVQLDQHLLNAQLELGKMYMGAKAVDRALEKAELVLAAAPETVGAVCLKAAVLVHQNRAEAATGLLNGLLSRGDGDAEVYMLLALAAMQQKNRRGARAVLRKGIAVHPNSIKLYTLLAGAEARDGRFDEAEKALRRIILLEPRHPEHRLKLADLLWQSHRQPQARRMLAEMIARHPKSEAPRLQVARFYFEHAGDPDEGVQILREGVAALPKSFELRFALSEIYLGENRPNEACRVLETCLTMESDPGAHRMVRTKNLLARAYLVKSDMASAETLVDEVIKASPKDVDAHFIKGQLYMVRQQGSDAVSEFRTVVMERPEFVKGHLRLAEARLLNREDSLALEGLLRASNALPGSKALHRALAQLYIRSKDYAAAEKQLNFILKTDPRDLGAAAGLGDFFAATGQLERAEAQYRAICEQAPDKDTGYLKLSRFYAVQKHTDRAVAVLARALNRNPGSQRLLSSLVNVYVLDGQTHKALEVCRRHLEKDPGKAPVHNLMGTVYLSRKDFVQAERAFSKAIELDSMWPVPYGNLVGVYMAQGRSDAAIEKFKADLTANPRNPGAYLALCKLYERKEAYQAAIKVYEKALALYPNMWTAANNMAFLLCENARGGNDLARAETWGRKAVQMRPDDPMVLDTMAWIAFKRGNPDQALRVMEKAMAKAPEDPALNYHMGAILVQSGHVIEAREKLVAALANGSRFPGRNAAEALLARLNE